MLRIIKSVSLTYPQQTLLVILNSAFFIWMQESSRQVIKALGLSESHQDYLPDWITTLVGSGVENFRSFLEASSWAWLVATISLIFIWRFISRLFRLLLLGIIIGVALWLIWQNQEILRQLAF